MRYFIILTVYIATKRISCILTIGTCMCVQCNVGYLIAGFEEGSIVLFGHRK